MIAVLVGLAALVVGADRLVSSPWLCGSCHEMAPRTETWRASAHARVSCVRCHVSPRPWYAFPESFAARADLLRQDVLKHVSGDYRDPVERRSPTEPMSDDVCLQCHDPERKATSGFRIRIDHGAHAKRNKSCVSCHVRTAHPRPTRGKALTLMGQCFTCHGSPRMPKASTECRLCHPADFPLLPGSHRNVEWRRRHGGVAKTDRRQCAMCHEERFCGDCHGVEMPHPKTWGQGPTGHAAVAARDRAVCARCHREKPDLCSMCHHKSYDPRKGTWVQQHFIEVREKGTTFCLDCHSPLYCARCHVRE